MSQQRFGIQHTYERMCAHTINLIRPKNPRHNGSLSSAICLAIFDGDLDCYLKDHCFKGKAQWPSQIPIARPQVRLPTPPLATGCELYIEVETFWQRYIGLITSICNKGNFFLASKQESNPSITNFCWDPVSIKVPMPCLLPLKQSGSIMNLWGIHCLHLGSKQWFIANCQRGTASLHSHDRRCKWRDWWGIHGATSLKNICICVCECNWQRPILICQSSKQDCHQKYARWCAQVFGKTSSISSHTDAFFQMRSNPDWKHPCVDMTRWGLKKIFKNGKNPDSGFSNYGYTT